MYILFQKDHVALILITMYLLSSEGTVKVWPLLIQKFSFFDRALLDKYVCPWKLMLINLSEIWRNCTIWTPQCVISCYK